MRHDAFGGGAQWIGSRLSSIDPVIATGDGLAFVWNDGEGAIAIPQLEFALAPGDLLLTAMERSGTLEGPDGWTARVVLLSDRRILDSAEPMPKTFALPFDGDGRLARMLKEIWRIADASAEFFHRDPTIPENFANIVIGIGAQMVNETTDGRLSPYASSTFARVRLTIQNHLGDPSFSVAALTNHMKISPRRLSSLFEPLGISPSRLISEMRIDRAKALLRDPVNARRDIASIARACGFDDQSYFTRRFRNLVGETPRGYRKLSPRGGAAVERVKGIEPSS